MLIRLIFRIILLVFYSVVSVESAFNQIPAQLRSTMSSGATNNLYADCNKKYTVIQSIGQSSVIGIFQSGKLYISQGFLHPSFSRAVERREISGNAVTYPNPFFGSFSVLLPGETRNNLFVLMLSIDGRVIFSGAYPPSHEITLNPGSITPGMYIIRIIADMQVYTCRIVKK